MMAFSPCIARPLSTPRRVFCSGSRPASIIFSDRSSKLSAVLLRPPQPRRLTFPLLFARRRNHSSAVAKTKLSKSKINPEYDEAVGDEIDEDAFEALFSQLEEDLKNDENISDVEDDEITEDDIAMLEQELEEAFSGEEFDEILEILPSKSDSTNCSDDEESRPKLKNWQLRQLARALKTGRRKTSIKNLSAELGLERAYVLQLLRDPPLNLLMLSSSLPNEVDKKPELVKEPVESSLDSDINISRVGPKDVVDVDVPVHVMQTRWSMQKRIKKVHLETLGRVYARTKRPTNAMISSIVHVTNLPWKKVVKWFEDKRLEDGVLVKREPFRRTMA